MCALSGKLLNLRLLCSNHHVKAQGFFLKTESVAVGEGIAGKLKVGGNIIFRHRTLSGFVVNDDVLVVDEVEFAFEGIINVRE